MVTEGPKVLRWYAAGVGVATLVGVLSMAGAEPVVSSPGSGGPKGPALAAKPQVRLAAPAPAPGTDCRKAKCIALTFDDGPMPDTARLLRTLKAKHVHATFFLVGQMVRRHPGLVRREMLDGHELGDHSWNHANLRRLSAAAVYSQLARTQDAVRKATGAEPKLFRPPYGSTSSKVATVARRFKLPQILWTVDPLDWRDRDTATVRRRVLRGARAGAIVLMHDIHPTTVSAVPDIIDRLARRGFVFVTVSELYGGRLAPGQRYQRLEVPRPPRPGSAGSAVRAHSG